MGSTGPSEDLRTLRARRWWRAGRPVASLSRAAAFVADVGFALLFPSRGLELPSLYGAASDLQEETLAVEWGPVAERVWAWKDELPRRGLAWYGRFLRGRPSFLSPALLADLYPGRGSADDFARRPSLSPEARRIAEVLLLSGPSSTTLLRLELGAEGRRGQARFSRAVTELGRSLLVTHHGVEEQEAGWPAAVLELTARAFDLRRPEHRQGDRGVRAAERFLRTMVAARPEELAAAFGWPVPRARSALQALVREGRARAEGPWFRASVYAPPQRQRRGGRPGARGGPPSGLREK